MKKLVSIACALALAASLTACGGGSKNLTDTYIKVALPLPPTPTFCARCSPS